MGDPLQVGEKTATTTTNLAVTVEGSGGKISSKKFPLIHQRDASFLLLHQLMPTKCILKFWLLLFTFLDPTSFFLNAPSTVLALKCFQCSEFPREEFSQDEKIDLCPGRIAIQLPGYSLYDGCMAISYKNGSLLAQNAVIFDYCLQEDFQRSLKQKAAESFAASEEVRITCCKTDFCNGSTKRKRKQRLLSSSSTCLCDAAKEENKVKVVTFRNEQETLNGSSSSSSPHGFDRQISPLSLSLTFLFFDVLLM